MLMFSIFDVMAEMFSPPFISRNVATASRQFQQFIATQDIIARSDFRLYKVGQWNDQLGTIDALDNPVALSKFDQAAEKFVDLTDI